MQVIQLNGLVRTEIKKSATKAIRNSGRVPGVIYHHGEENVHFSVAENELLPLIYTSESHLVEVNLDKGGVKQGLVKEFQFDPVSDKCIHFDLQAVAGDEKVTVEVPVATTGSSVGVTKNGGLLQINLHHLRIRCDQKHLPDHITLDISGLDVGDSIHVGDIKLDGIQILEDSASPVVSVTRKRGEEHDAAAAAGPAEPEVVAKGKKEAKA